MTRHDDDSFENSLGILLRSALRQRVDPETRNRHLHALTACAEQMREGSEPAEVVPLRPRWQRAYAVAAVFAMLAFASTSVLAASQRALPGDVLYAVKRGTEQARLLLATSPEATAGVHAEIALERAEEAQLLAAAEGTAASPQVQSLESEARSENQAGQDAAPGVPALDQAQEGVQQEIDGARELIGEDASPTPGASTAPTPSPPDGDEPVPAVPLPSVGPEESRTVQFPGSDPTLTPPPIPGAGGSVIPSNQES